MKWLALACGMVRVQVGVDEAAAVEQAAVVGDACASGQGTCTEANACAEKVPMLSLYPERHMPMLSWCGFSLVCCKTPLEEFRLRIKFNDGERYSELRVRENALVDDLLALVEADLAEHGEGYAFRLVKLPEGSFRSQLERGLGRRLADYDIRDHGFTLAVTRSLLGGIANGVESPWDHVPFAVKLTNLFQQRDEATGEVGWYSALCSGALIGKYVFTAAHCFNKGRDAPAEWTVHAHQPQTEFRVGDKVTVWSTPTGRFAANKYPAVITEVPGRWSIWSQLKARPTSWSAGSGYTWDHVEASGTAALRVTNIWRHDKYLKATDQYDFAIMEVVLPSGWVAPALPMLDSEDTGVNRPIAFAGFGERENGDSGELRTAVLTTERCHSFERESLYTVRCAASGYRNDLTTCVGDSGGPVFYSVDRADADLFGAAGAADPRGLRSSGAAVGSGRDYVLTAVNSFGYAGTCGTTTKKTGVNMIARNRDFIERTLPASDQRLYLEWL